MPSRGFELLWTTASVPKSGQRQDENEDACAANPNAGRFAVADGASEGWRSGPWARHLATAFAKTPPDPASYPAWLASTRLEFPNGRPQALSWYAEEKQAQGAFATLLGVAFREAANGSGAAWKAVAVGDSCVFQVRDGSLVTAFPIDTPGRFGNQPPLVSSTGNGPEPEWFAGRAEIGDEFFLLTDGLAEWFLRETFDGGPPVATLNEHLDNPAAAAFRAWVHDLKQSHSLRDDDTTAVRVRLEHARRVETPS
jgi:serine/threonine protein phosphatase PrpC